MSRRLIIILVAVAALVIPAVVIVVLVNRSPKLQNTVLQVANLTATPLTNTVIKTNTNVPVDPLAKDRTAVVFVARTFAERFGSTSNQNNFANFTSAEVYGTTSFNASLERSIAQQKLTAKTTPYTATITKALSMNVTVLTSTNSQVAVSTQREETVDRAVRVYYQDLLLELQKVGSDWKVSAASWKVI